MQYVLSVGQNGDGKETKSVALPLRYDKLNLPADKWKESHGSQKAMI